MEKELTYQEMLNAFDAFGNDLAQARLGWKLSLYVSRNIDYLKSHVDHYHSANNTIIGEHSVPVEDSKDQRVVPPERVEQFRKETLELLNTRVEVEYDQISFNALSEQEREKFEETITPKIMYAISYTFEE